MQNKPARALNADSVGNDNGCGQNGSRRLRFGVFELDLRAGELHRSGIKVKLQEQPLRVLTQLLERPGDVVTREELRERLWPADTFVDFDHSLNAAIRRVRDALGDSAENPTFVETVARRGYRFLAPVSSHPANGRAPAVSPSTADTSTTSADRRHFWWFIAGTGAGAVILLLIGLKLGFLLGRRHSPPTPTRNRQLTANPEDDRVRAAAVSRDGKYLAYSDETGFYLRQIDTGEIHCATLPEGLKAVAISWFPDRDHMVVALTNRQQQSSLWEISALGGSARQLNDDGTSPAVSPDGKEVAFLTGAKAHQQVWLIEADGRQPRKLAGNEGDVFGALAWSPDGTELAYTRGRLEYGFGATGAIEVLELHNPSHTATPLTLNHWSLMGLDGPLAWTADNHLIYTLVEAPPHDPDSNLWSVALDSHGKPIDSPVRLTDASGSVFSVSISGDGKRIAYVKGVPQPDVYVARLEGPFTINEPQRLTLDDRRDLPYDWTVDGKDVIFTSDRTGTLNVYKQAVDKTVPELLVRGSHPMVEARLNSDGTQLLYVEYPKWGEMNPTSPLMRVPLAGGTPRKVLEANWISNHQCGRAPATVCVYSVVHDHTLTFFTFDPYEGSGKQVFTVEDDLPQLYNWSLSPDSATLAIAKAKSDGMPRIHLVKLKDASERWLTIHDYPGIGSLDWAADSKSIWAVSTGEEENTLLNIDLRGVAHAVWRPKKKAVGWAIPSRDGRFLALYVGSSSANVWMIERP
jgi:Tol biopolymer transport system component/DNA-binding winged helix-turn-helix (wHTH) protein